MNNTSYKHLHVSTIRSASYKTATLKDSVPCVIDTGHNYGLVILSHQFSNGRTRFRVVNPHTGRTGWRVAEDIYRAMRDRAKLKVLDALRELNRDETTTVINVTEAMI